MTMKFLKNLILVVFVVLWHCGLCVTRRFPEQTYKKFTVAGEEHVLTYERCLTYGADAPTFKSNVDVYTLFQDDTPCACIELTRIKKGEGSEALITLELTKFHVQDYQFYPSLIDFFKWRVLRFLAHALCPGVCHFSLERPWGKILLLGLRERDALVWEDGGDIFVGDSSALMAVKRSRGCQS